MGLIIGILRYRTAQTLSPSLPPFLPPKKRPDEQKFSQGLFSEVYDMFTFLFNRNVHWVLWVLLGTWVYASAKSQVLMISAIGNAGINRGNALRLCVLIHQN